MNANVFDQVFRIKTDVRPLSELTRTKNLKQDTCPPEAEKHRPLPNIRRQKEREDAPGLQQYVQFSRAVGHTIISRHTGGSLVYELPDDFFHLALVGIDQVQQDLAKGAAHALEVPLVEVHALEFALRMDLYKQNKNDAITTFTLGLHRSNYSINSNTTLL